MGWPVRAAATVLVRLRTSAPGPRSQLSCRCNPQIKDLMGGGDGEAAEGSDDELM